MQRYVISFSIFCTFNTNVLFLLYMAGTLALKVSRGPLWQYEGYQIRAVNVFRDKHLHNFGQVYQGILIYDTLFQRMLPFEGSSYCLILTEGQKQPTRDVLQNRCSQRFYKFHRKTRCWSLFLIKLEAFRPGTLLKRDRTPPVAPFRSIQDPIKQLLKVRF